MNATETGRRDDPARLAAGPRESEVPKSVPVPRHISGEELARIRREVSVVDLCRDYRIELLPRGEQWVGRCPFHPDPPHDLVVTPATNQWSCSGQGAESGGNVELVMKLEGVSLRHAVEILKRKLGLTPPPAILTTHAGTSRSILVDPSDDVSQDELMTRVIEFYHQTLLNDPKAMDYLRKRGCADPEAVRLFKLGYANRTLGYRVPEGTVAGRKLRERLQQIGIYRQSGHEHFSGCIVIPVLHAQGRVLEVYGRRLFVQSGLKARAPKHLCLPDPPAGVWNAHGLADQSEWLLCQSLTDALSLWCLGFHNVTATYGPHGFTPDHWALFNAIKPKRLVICYRNDEQGNSAAHELAQQMIPRGVEVWRMELPPHSDVNDCVRASREPKAELACLLTGSTRLIPLEQLAAPAQCVDRTGPPALAPSAAEQPEPAQPQFKVLSEEQQAEFTTGPDESPRHWRVRGLEANTSFDRLKVTIRLQHADRFHLDTLDLYSARARTAFLTAAEQITGTDKACLQTDLAALVNHLEQHQDQRLLKSLTLEDPAPVLTPIEETEALRILKSHKLIDVVVQDFHRCGLVGEDTNLTVAWLASLSRKLDKPLGVCVMSRSAAGKSSLLEAVAQFVPEEDRHQYTALTPQALFHMPEGELAHKALFVAEDVGAEGAAYSLKTIQSDGRLVIACTMQDEDTGRMRTRTKTVRGPVAVFLTSTSRGMDDELLNRLLVLSVDESEEQTRRIHLAQRHAQTLQGILEHRARPRIIRLQQNLQRLIRPLTVRNPLADKLRFSSGQLRARRDNQKHLDLIRTIALVHQYQRDIKTATDLDGQPFQYIEATAQDVALADRLLQSVLPDTLDELTPQAHRLLDRIRQLTAHQMQAGKQRWDSIWWTCRQLREQTGWSNRQLRQALAQLTDYELLARKGSGQGRLALYRLYDAPDANLSATFPALVRPERISPNDSAIAGSVIEPTAFPLWRQGEPNGHAIATL